MTKTDGPGGGTNGRVDLLAAAVAVLTGGSDDLDLCRTAEHGVLELAAEFNRERRRHGQKTPEGKKIRVDGVSADLARIEAACAALVTAFAEASDSAFDALNGAGIGGLPLVSLGRALMADDRSKRAARRALADRYRIPLGRRDFAAEMVADVEHYSRRDPIRVTVPPDWPVAVAALGAAVRDRRLEFEDRFRTEVERFNEVLDQGPSGRLRSASGRAAQARTRTGRPLARRNAPGDRGGQESVSALMRGDPKWVLARGCHDLFGRVRAGEVATGTEGGPLHRFTLAVYAYATGEEPEEVVDRGESYGAGLLRHVKAAVRILPALADLNMRRGKADPFAPLTPEEVERKASLERAYLTGRVPPWMERRVAKHPR